MQTIHKNLKKRLFALAGAAVLTLSLAACGNQSGSSSEDPGAGAGQTEDLAAAGNADVITSATRPASAMEQYNSIMEAVNALVYENEEGQMVVSHKYGETVVPENPERIISIKLEDLMLALEVDMVACRNFETFYLEDQINALGIDTIAVDEEADTVNLEQVLSYAPDLIIIRDSFDQSVYDELSKIAPTVAFRIQDTEVSLMAIGRILGIEDKAEARLEQYEEKIVAAREALASLEGEEVSMVRVLKKEIRLYPYSTNGMNSFLYQELGLTPDPMVVEYDNSDNLAISLEMLPELTSDHIFLVAGYGSAVAEDEEEAKAAYAEIQADPLWQMVPAVQSGNVYEVDSRVWLTYGILATEMKIDDVLAVLAPDAQ